MMAVLPKPPLRTIEAADDKAYYEKPGCKIYVKGGVYKANQFCLYGSGISKAKPTIWEGYRDEQGRRVVIDCSECVDDGLRIRAKWIVLRHIDVCNSKFDGVKDHKETARENTYEDVRSYNNNGKGFCVSTSNNLLIKCVAWDNVDRTGTGPGEHGDGFAMNDGAENNRFIECVSYRNSDDGFDTYGSRRNVFIRCIAYQNGINRLNLNPFAGDGNGFKLGIAFGDESQAHNIAFRCLAYNNRLAGFDFNGGAGNYIINCTAYSDKPVEFKNPRTFKMGDRSGLANYLINNLAYPAPAEEDITDELTRAAQRTNSWNSYTIKTTDLLSLAPNSPNFMKLSASSPLRNKGTDISQNSAYSEVVSRLINTDLGYIGLTDLGYIGLPDLGCFED